MSEGNNSNKYLSEGCGLALDHDFLSARVSIVCAVDSVDPNRWTLLGEHYGNLRAQTIPVNPIYVLDQGERSPLDLDAEFISIDRKLSRYEALVAGFSAAKTEFVGNLSLGDRFLQTGCETLVGTLLSSGAGFGGGEWNVYFHRDLVEEASSLDSIQPGDFSSDWPPPQSREYWRLGSGDGARPDYGPATIWRRAILSHIGFPVYFGNGQPISKIGDKIFWHMLNKKNISMVRSPRVIGSCHMNSSAQTELAEQLERKQLELGIKVLRELDR